MKRVLALLDSMWASATNGTEAPRFFRISERNHSGRRLYNLVGDNNLLVTNSTGHGKPDPEWVAESLKQAEPFDLLLVCGKVAQATYRAAGYVPKAHIMELPHPAARNWTIAKTQLVKNDISRVLGGVTE